MTPARRAGGLIERIRASNRPTTIATTTTNEDNAAMTDTDTQDTADILADRKDDEGNLIDPPTIPEYEQRLSAAANAADDAAIGRVQDEYNQAREDQVRAEVERERAAKDDEDAR